MALFNIANCYAANNQLSEAKEKFEQFLQTTSSDEAMQEALAMMAKIDDAMKKQIL